MLICLSGVLISSHVLGRITMKRILRGALLLTLLTICAMPAGAVEKRAKSHPKRSIRVAAPAAVGPECPAGETVGQAGFRAFIDPQTGELREPTPEEVRALAGRAREESLQPVESLEAVVHPDGMISVDLKGLFMQSLVVVRNPDGLLSARCGPGTEKPVPVSKPAHAPALEER
jgi:hypothetical protein